jgi:histidyl-tRNA synthetase
MEFANIEEEIKNLDKIINQNDKIKIIKNIKEKIKNEETKIDKLILSLDDDNDDILNDNIDEIIYNLENFDNLNEKINNYHLLVSYINKLNDELFKKN